jgi:RHS repeat-associated protein
MQGSRHFAPYGEPFGAQGSFDLPFGFTGEPTDGNGLVHLRARYLNPSLGVFPSLDPVEGVLQQATSLNRYGYVAGNVVNLVDPSGMIGESPSRWDSCRTGNNNNDIDCLCYDHQESLFIRCRRGDISPCTCLPTGYQPGSGVRQMPPISEVECKAIVLAFMNEAANRTNQREKEIVMHVILNRLLETNDDHLDIVQDLTHSSNPNATFQVGGPVLTCCSGQPEEQVCNGYECYSSFESSCTNCNCIDIDPPKFKKALDYVQGFLNSPPPDFTQGAIRFVHAKDDAQLIVAEAQRCADCPTDIIRDGRRVSWLEYNAFLDPNYHRYPILNGSEIIIGYEGSTVYSNLSITPNQEAGSYNCC